MFKKLAAIVLGSMFALTVAVLPFSGEAATRVNGYFKKNGTYVQPYYRTSPNKSLLDNYSTKGNYNPYTGKAGTVDPYKSYTLPSYKAPSIKSYTYPSYKLPKTGSPLLDSYYQSEYNNLFR